MPSMAYTTPRTSMKRGLSYIPAKLQSRPMVALAGRTGIGTLYAVYALVEMLGATFVLTKDLLPPPVDDLSVPATSRVWEPAFTRRGLQPFANDLQDVTWGEAYYRMLIDQMVKLRMNYSGVLRPSLPTIGWNTRSAAKRTC